MNKSNRLKKLLSAAGAAAKPHHRVMMRGGRLRKTGRGVVTHGPRPGLVAAAAMGAGMAAGAGGAMAHGTHSDIATLEWRELADPDSPGPTPHREHGGFTDPETAGQAVGQADGCVEGEKDANDNAEVVCSGRVTTAQMFTIPVAAAGSDQGNPTITGREGFSADVATGDAFRSTRETRYSDGLSMILEGNIAAPRGHGVYAFHEGSYYNNNSLILTTANATAGEDGIFSRIGGDGIDDDFQSSEIMTTVNGSVAAGGTGVSVTHDSVTTNRIGIIVRLGGSVAGGVNADGTDKNSDIGDNVAVSMMGGRKRLILMPGAGAFTGKIMADAGSNPILEFAGNSGDMGSTSLSFWAFAPQPGEWRKPV